VLDLENNKIKKLIESSTRPDLSDIQPVLKELNVTDARVFWDLFDKIILLWSENKAYVSLNDLG